MNRRFALAFIVLACTALPVRATGIGFCFDKRFTGSVQLNFSCSGTCYPSCGSCFPGCGTGCGAGGAPLAPWYLYWPADAHFQTPAPMTYPFWPAPQVAPGAGAAFQPACYNPTPPPYWYGR